MKDEREADLKLAEEIINKWHYTHYEDYIPGKETIEGVMYANLSKSISEAFGKIRADEHARMLKFAQHQEEYAFGTCQIEIDRLEKENSELNNLVAGVKYLIYLKPTGEKVILEKEILKYIKDLEAQIKTLQDKLDEKEAESRLALADLDRIHLNHIQTLKLEIESYEVNLSLFEARNTKLREALETAIIDWRACINKADWLEQEKHYYRGVDIDMVRRLSSCQKALNDDGKRGGG